MDPKTAEYTYGRTISRNFLVLQATVINSDPDYSFLIEDVSFNAQTIAETKKSPLNGSAQNEPGPKAGGSTLSPATTPVTLSSVDLSVLRGAVERGQYLDPRNAALRILRATGTVAGGIIGITRFPLDYAPAVAAFNGPVTSAFEGLFPDYTINQLNRINDNAYSANTVVPIQHSKPIAIFIPQAMLWGKTEKKQFLSDPHEALLALASGTKLTLLVTGEHITSTSNLAPAITSIALTSPAKNLEGDNSQVSGVILGKNLSGSTISLVAPPRLTQRSALPVHRPTRLLASL